MAIEKTITAFVGIVFRASKIVLSIINAMKDIGHEFRRQPDHDALDDIDEADKTRSTLE